MSSFDVSVPIPFTDAGTDFAKWMDAETIEGTENPSRYAARTFARRANAIAALLKQLTAKVMSTTSQIEKLNGYMKLMNDGIAWAAKAGVGGDGGTILTSGTLTQMEDLQDELVDAGIKGTFSIADAGGGVYNLRMVKTDAEAALSNLRIQVDDISTRMQEENLTLQRMMTLYDTNFQGVTSAIDKAWKQGKAVTDNIRR